MRIGRRVTAAPACGGAPRRGRGASLPDDGLVPNNRQAAAHSLPAGACARTSAANPNEPSRRCSDRMAGAAPGSTASMTFTTTIRPLMRCSASREARPRSSSAVRRDCWSISTAGDAVAIPAGVGHCLIAGDDLVVVGAYPEGQDWDLCRATEADRAKALENIPWVPLPKLDPVFGAGRSGAGDVGRLGASLDCSRSLNWTSKGAGARALLAAFCGSYHACRGQPAWRPHNQSSVGCGFGRVRDRSRA